MHNSTWLGVPHFSEKIKFNSLKSPNAIRLPSYGGNFNPDKDLLKYLKFLKKSKLPSISVH